MTLVALTLGSISLIASTACATIIFNAIFAPMLLNEKFKIFPDGCTILLLSIGSILAAFQQPSLGPPVTYKTIKSKILSTNILYYFLAIVLVICLRKWYLNFLKTRLKEF